MSLGSAIAKGIAKEEIKQEVVSETKKAVSGLFGSEENSASLGVVGQAATQKRKASTTYDPLPQFGTVGRAAKKWGNPTLSVISQQIANVFNTLTKINKTFLDSFNLNKAIYLEKMKNSKETEIENPEQMNHAVNVDTSKLEASIHSLISKLDNSDFKSTNSGSPNSPLDPLVPEVAKDASKTIVAEQAAKEATKVAAEKTVTKTAAKNAKTDAVMKSAGVVFKSGAKTAAQEAEMKTAGVVFKDASKVTTEKAIEASAKKIVPRAIAKAAGKSIPFLGIGLGAAFAYNKLKEGDYTGAGLEFVGGAGSLLTSIPASIASASRDVYKSVYGIQPEDDPKRGERLQNVINIVKKYFSEKESEQKSDTDKKTTTHKPASKLLSTKTDKSMLKAQVIASTQSPKNSDVSQPIDLLAQVKETKPINILPEVIKPISMPIDILPKTQALMDDSEKEESVQTSMINMSSPSSDIPPSVSFPSQSSSYAGTSDVPDPNFYEAFSENYFRAFA